MKPVISAGNNKVEALCGCCVPTQQQRPRPLYHQTVSSTSSIHHSLTFPPSVALSLQIVAAILAIAGIVMMTYADGFHSHSVIGITLVVASASMSALYKVFVCI